MKMIKFFHVRVRIAAICLKVSSKVQIFDFSFFLLTVIFFNLLNLDRNSNEYVCNSTCL